MYLELSCHVWEIAAQFNPFASSHCVTGHEHFAFVNEHCSLEEKTIEPTEAGSQRELDFHFDDFIDFITYLVSAGHYKSDFENFLELLVNKFTFIVFSRLQGLH
jgi:hypothetical protein